MGKQADAAADVQQWEGAAGDLAHDGGVHGVAAQL
jgi:hypothetical protein